MNYLFDPIAGFWVVPGALFLPSLNLYSFEANGICFSQE